MEGQRLAQRVNLVGPWLRARLGGPVVKVGLDAGLGCPNRDGALSRGGCAFCPPSGSGAAPPGQDPAAQLAAGLQSLAARAARQGKRPPRVLAYFQAYSSTHGPAPLLARLYEQARSQPGVAGLIVSTRPDCLDPARWDVLERQARAGLFWLELGLQSAHDSTLAALGRGHDVACFDRALAQAQERGIPVVAHVILGLPGESPAHCLATAEHLARLGVWGVKLHNLMVLAQTRLAQDLAQGRFTPWNRAQWVEAAAGFLARLPAATLVHRLAADPGRERLLAPAWAVEKDLNLTALAEYLEDHNLKQGALCPSS